MPRLTPVDKEIVRAMVMADADAGPDDYARFESIFQAALRRSGLDHARRLEAIALRAACFQARRSKQEALRGLKAWFGDLQ